jgi:hypothetical protein
MFEFWRKTSDIGLLQAVNPEVNSFIVTIILKRFDFLYFSSMKLSSLIWCIVGCRIPSNEIFAEKYETEIMRKEIFMDPTLCSTFQFV